MVDVFWNCFIIAPHQQGNIPMPFDRRRHEVTNKPNNPAAFPGGVNQVYTNVEPGDPTQEGMLLRDYFAAQVVSAVFHGVFEDWRQNKADVQEDWPTGIAVDAYRVADAMLKIREAT